MCHDAHQVFVHVVIWIGVCAASSGAEFAGDVVVREETKTGVVLGLAKYSNGLICWYLQQFCAIEYGNGSEAGTQVMVACLFEFSSGEVRRRLVVSKLYVDFVGRFCQNGDVGRWQLPTSLVEKREVRSNKR